MMKNRQQASFFENCCNDSIQPFEQFRNLFYNISLNFQSSESSIVLLLQIVPLSCLEFSLPYKIWFKSSVPRT